MVIYVYVAMNPVQLVPPLHLAYNAIATIPMYNQADSAVPHVPIHTSKSILTMNFHVKLGFNLNVEFQGGARFHSSLSS